MVVLVVLVVQTALPAITLGPSLAYRQLLLGGWSKEPLVVMKLDRGHLNFLRQPIFPIKEKKLITFLCARVKMISG